MAIEKVIDYLGIPATIGLGLIITYAILQLIGELIELKGKIVPEFFKIRKYFKRKKEERLKKEREHEELLKEVKTRLDEFNKHYDADNIAKRDKWMSEVNDTMKWVHERAEVYDKSIVEITEGLSKTANELKSNTEITQDMFVESSRDRIIDFAEKAYDDDTILSHEQFRRIFRVYEDYENWLKDHNRTNGEVDTAYELIQAGYKHRIKNRSFAEDIKIKKTK